MIRGMWLSAAALVMLAVPAIAAAPDAACMAPEMPKMPDGKTAPAKDIIAAANSVKKYVADSDAYQTCLNEVEDKMEAEAKAAKAAMDPKIKADLDAKHEQNQTNKERLGAMYSATAAAYRQAHPK